MSSNNDESATPGNSDKAPESADEKAEKRRKRGVKTEIPDHANADAYMQNRETRTRVFTVNGERRRVTLASHTEKSVGGAKIKVFKD